ncbi:hypothetical protein EOD39_8145 [Acipenser ruthenus]|uniref:Uncharacterized protein n=1 Tax=Acipenser ruthenus TaxID=7906 RepID=A0A444U4M9_ACIRT|nr:hypothetical protein EOD39_8145 [Acipenser ruthenus]
MDLTATIRRPTEEDEDGDIGKPERGKGGPKKGGRQKRVQRSQDSWHCLLKPGQPLQCSLAKHKHDQKK